MITISIKEAAELKSISIRSIQRYIKQGKIISVKTDGKNMIPISAFTETEQIRYYREHNIELPKELTKQKAKTVQRSTDLESYTADQREEMVLWNGILREWEAYLINKKSKTAATKEFAAIAAEKYPEVRISSDILYRKKRALKAFGQCGLVDLRGGHNKGSSSIPGVVWNTFLNFYLDQRKYPITQCYDWTKAVILDECPELMPLASYNTFTRHIKSDISLAVKTMGREGDKAFKDRCTPYIKRIYDNLESNDIWFGDNHTLDIESLSENGKLHRLHMSTFQDARSGIIVGFVLSDGNTGQTTLLSLRKSIMNFGCCKTVYLDNGREYMVTDIAGLGHRQKKSTADRKNPPTVLQRLNVGLINAIVRNAQAKNVERAFRNVKDNFSRLFDTFVGGNVLEKPERLKLVLKGKQGHIPTDKEVGEALEEYIYNVFNLAPYQGRVRRDRGKPKLQVFEDNLRVKIVIPESDLNLMLMRSSRVQKVGQRGVHLGDIDYWNDELLTKYSGEQVYYRYDPDDLSSVRVYDLEDRYLMTVSADNKAVCEFGASQEDLKAAMKTVKTFTKITREALKAQTTTAFGKKNALEVVMAQAKQNKQEIKIAEGDYIIDIRRADEQEVYEKAVGAEDDNLVSFDRMIQNLESRLEE